MKSKQILAIAIIISMICFGCEKNSDDATIDYAKTASGTYSGTWVVVGTGQTYGTCEVVKVTATSVNLKMTAGGTTIPTLPDVKLSDGGSGKVKISYTDSGGTLTGTIENKTISFTLKAGTITETFTGTKP
jgi:hypothetical protein